MQENKVRSPLFQLDCSILSYPHTYLHTYLHNHITRAYWALPNLGGMGSLAWFIEYMRYNT
jgi:hypothetical protein